MDLFSAGALLMKNLLFDIREVQINQVLTAYGPEVADVHSVGGQLRLNESIYLK